ncbi:MAG: ATP-binding protein [Acidimicrobiia bacterium]
MASLRRLLAPVRNRATLGASLVVACFCIVASALFLVLLRASLVQILDDAVAELAEDVAAEVEQDLLPPVFVSDDDDSFILVVDASGQVVSRSDNLAEATAAVVHIQPTSDESARTVELPVGRGGDFRVVTMQATGPDGQMTVYAGSTIDVVTNEVRVARSLLAAGVPLLLALVGATTWVVVGRSLRPVEAIRAEVADITARDLHRRVSEPPTGDEVARLAATMNAMLDRLEGATERQRRFVGDASHELRSPLAALRADLEVALSGRDGEAEWASTARRLLGDVERQEALVQDLLFLARADESTAARNPTLVDLDDLVLTEVSRLRLRAPVSVDISGVSGAPVRGHWEDLARVVRNLLENAVRYAASQVTVRLGVEDGWAVLSVEDDGPGIPTGERGRVFERFARVDSGRSRRMGGTGLGLAIAREVVVDHGGTVTIDDGGVGARLVVHLPAEP